MLSHYNVSLYLCGHLHTLVSQMYARHDNFLELEVGDWRDNRKFRLMAIDHDLISFADLSFNSWPALLVLNPKDARFINDAREPLHLIGTSLRGGPFAGISSQNHRLVS
eukprot:m.562170 g.562170  ORF g.562170 m.562170 type:complete len:109 (-) comp57799_c0_seq2:1344-1670(-)